ncbi:MAG: SMP-30/gluconolactonase/LRE family protein [Polyangiaceae bacterium]
MPPPDEAGGIIDQNGTGFSTIEGPVWINALFVSEFPGSPTPPPSRIIEITGPGMVSVPGPAGWNPGSNGLAVDPSGNLIACVHKDGSISRMDVVAGTATPIASSYMGARFNAPNDLAIRSDGTIYFSDPAGFQSPTPAPQAQERVYRIAPGTNAVSVVEPQSGATPLTSPNGVSLSIDEKTLYVSSKNGVYAYPVMADGSVGVAPSTPFSALDIDGMTLDCSGNIYGAVIGTETVAVVSPAGATIATITVSGGSSTTNTAFGGADHQTLYITTQGTGGGQSPSAAGAQGIFQVALAIPGWPY